MKKHFLLSSFLIALILVPALSIAQTTIDVSVQGISDGNKDSKQQDRDEAILDAKLKAIERAGVSVEAVTTMENFKLKKDWVESKANAVILPGFQIIDVGYGADGLYHVVLTGKVSKGGGDIGDSEGDKKFRMAKLLQDKDKNRAMSLLKEVVDNHGDCSAADDALYHLITNVQRRDSADEYLLQLKAYHPDSPYIAEAESYLSNWNKNILQRLDFKFVTIPSGSFQMGSTVGNSDEKPVHRVNIESFQMMTKEVTQAQWEAVMVINRSDFNGENLPVEQVSWNDCQKFISKLNALDQGKGYRLPTEAEWEYACRAGTTSQYHSGNNESDLGRAAWYGGNSGSKTHPVGQKWPNAWGLYDMHGNVWEWCEDSYHNSYSGAPNDGSARVSPSGSSRVLRGGDWSNYARGCRSANRRRNTPDYRGNYLGFRLVRSVGQ